MRARKKKDKKVIPAGTPYSRFNWIMDELEKRYPDPEPFSSSSPEVRLLAELDYERNMLRGAIKLAKQALDDWTRTVAPEHCHEEHVRETQIRLREFGTLYYIAMVQQHLTKALGENDNQD